MSELAAAWLRPVFYLGRNSITLTGAVITTSSGMLLALFWGLEAFGKGLLNPYVGILLYLILPTVFVFGLILMPIGALARRRQLRKHGGLPHEYPQFSLGDPLVRTALGWVGFATFLNVAILGFASYRGVQYMDSVSFCGQTCHTVMAPEYTAYENSPHSRVDCVGCHIGPGAPWFVRSKLSGLRQVVAVTFRTYSRPIPSPVHQLRPARETCEQCHWPQRFTGDKLLVRREYGTDEKNTEATTVLALKIGGRTWQGRVGIHGRHLDTMERISYIATDDRRQVIPEVTYIDDDGKTVVYRSTDLQTTPEQLAKGEHRKMDCVDCHNRPTHAFQLPEHAVDQSMASGLISASLPYIKKQAVEVLKTDYPDRDTASREIASKLGAFYQKQYPDVHTKQRAAMDQAVAHVQAIYLRNVFPEMRLTWGTHPNNIGHMDFPGCFRCHDGNHVSSDGRTITNDCGACHSVLAMSEQNPKILSDLGWQ